MVNINERLLELGTRYLARSGEEVLQLREFLQKFSNAESAALKEIALKDIEVVAHRIRGSGAMFGFPTLSDVAGKLEMLAVDATQRSPAFSSLGEELMSLINAVDEAVRNAQRERSP
jgi:chemotaxis protein histidine kinase CheA